LVQEGVEAGFIHPEDAADMVPEEARAGRYYGLAKNHKARAVWPAAAGGRCPPLRPVVSGSGTVDEGLSKWVDEHAKGEVTRLPTYLEDTRHLLQIIQEENERGPQPPGTVPVTADVVGMYTNVPIEEGLMVFQRLMDDREDKTVPTSFLVKIMRFIANSSVFIFDTHYFIQLMGVAMGKPSSPTFACLFVGMLEAMMLGAWERQGGGRPDLLRRFIDDLFFLWRHGREELDRFVGHLNSSHRTVKFEMSVNFEARSVDFLDLTVYIDNNGFIQTTLFEKPCRVVSYLLPSSCHPSFITKNIPYSLAFRLVRIESTAEGLEKNLMKLQQELNGRGYRPAIVAAAMDRAKELSRAATLLKVPRPASRRPVLSLPYDPRLPAISSILHRRHRALLSNDRDAQEYFELPPMVTYTRTKNLRDLLIRAQVPALRRPLRRAAGFHKCGRRVNCAMCLHSENTAAFTCPYTGVTVSITQHITCQSAGVYLVKCVKDTGDCARLCPTYIGITGGGETSRTFTKRTGEHLGSAMQPCQAETTKPIGRHFRLPGHDPHRDMRVVPLEVVRGDIFLLRARERYYINLFGTEKRRGVEEVEHGLNLDQGQ
jgi:hypothetical protein